MVDRNRVLVTILVLVIVVLVGVILFAFLIKPAISGYLVDKQSEGAVIAVSTIWQRAAQCQTVPLTLGNQTINLVAVECLQQGQQTASQ